MGVRSMFRLSLRSSPPPPPTAKPEAPSPTTDDIDEISLPEDPEARYIPRQWAPNRLQTLYVTPSEQNLYLAAMSQLDRAPPPLPLWTEPAPSLPAVPHQAAMDPTPPSILSPPRGAPLRLPPNGLSSKFVMSPGMPTQGLSIREEFRAVAGAAGVEAPKEHALLALSDESQLRFHNFPVDVLFAVQEVLKDAWPRGRRSAYPELKELAQKTAARQEGNTWIVVLKGNVWRQAGRSELDSIRLILALLTTLSIHGWVLVDRMQAAGVKYDNHNLLFAHSAAVQAVPPTYFAVSIPLPDRISLISPPPKATPMIISAVREAIESQTALNKRRARRGLPKGGGGDRTSVISAGRPKSGVEWDAWKGNIRLEGWVHGGVYRFWLGGMRRWLGNGVKWRVVEKLHPSLILTLINALSAQHFTLLTSLPLLPLVKGRDILIFASQQSSGLTYCDTWKPSPSAADDDAADASRAESIVMINSSDAEIHAGEVVPPEMEESVRAASTEAARQEAAGAMADERRRAAGLGEGFVSAQATSPVRTRHRSLQPTPRNVSPIRLPPPPTPHQQQKDLVPAPIPSPRQRNLLVKKNSLTREGNGNGKAVSRSSSLRRNQDPPSAHQRFASLDERRPTDSLNPGSRPDYVNITSRHGIGSEHSVEAEAEWTMVDVASNARNGSLGLSMYAPNPVQGVETAPPSTDGTKATPAWNDIETPMPPPLPPRLTQPYTAIPAPSSATQHPRQHSPTRAYAAHVPTHHARPSTDSDRSIYTDAPTPGQGPYSNLPPTTFTTLPSAPLRSDPMPYETPLLRDLKIANPTPPPVSPLSSAPFGLNTTASNHVPLIQPISPLKGRDAWVDVGQGTGVESVRGSVGYMPSLASQSVYGLTPAISEGGPILGAWDPQPSQGQGSVPMPMPTPHVRREGEGNSLAVPVTKGKKRESMRNMFGFKHSTSGEGGAEGVEKVPGDNGLGSSRTKVSIGA